MLHSEGQALEQSHNRQNIFLNGREVQDWGKWRVLTNDSFKRSFVQWQRSSPLHSEPFSRRATGFSALQLLDLFLNCPPLATKSTANWNLLSAAVSFWRPSHHSLLTFTKELMEGPAHKDALFVIKVDIEAGFRGWLCMHLKWKRSSFNVIILWMIFCFIMHIASLLRGRKLDDRWWGSGFSFHGLDQNWPC